MTFIFTGAGASILGFLGLGAGAAGAAAGGAAAAGAGAAAAGAGAAGAGAALGAGAGAAGLGAGAAALAPEAAAAALAPEAALIPAAGLGPEAVGLTAGALAAPEFGMASLGAPAALPAGGASLAAVPTELSTPAGPVAPVYSQGPGGIPGAPPFEPNPYPAASPEGYPGVGDRISEALKLLGKANSGAQQGGEIGRPQMPSPPQLLPPVPQQPGGNKLNLSVPAAVAIQALQNPAVRNALALRLLGGRGGALV